MLLPQVEQHIGLLVEDHFDVAGTDQVIIHLIPLPIAGLWKKNRVGLCQATSWHEVQQKQHLPAELISPKPSGGPRQAMVLYETRPPHLLWQSTACTPHPVLHTMHIC